MKGIILSLLLLFTIINGYSQKECDSTFEALLKSGKTIKPSCDIVLLSQNKYVDYVSAKRDLEKVRVLFPRYEATIDSIKSINDSIKKQYVILVRNCERVAIALNNENTILRNKLEIENRRKRKWRMIAASSFVVTILLIWQLST